MLAQVAEEINRMQQLLADQDKTLQERKAEQAQAELNRADIDRGLIRWRQDEQRLKLAVETCRQELEQTGQRTGQQQALVEKTKILLESLREREAQNKGKIDEWQALLVKTQAERDLQDQTVTALRLRQNDLSHRRQNAVADQARQAEERQRHDSQWQDLQAEMATVAGQTEQTASELQQAIALREVLLQKIDGYRTFRNELYAAKTNLLSEVQKLDRSLRDLKRRSHELEERVHALRLDSAKYEYELKHCRDQIETQYNLSLAEAYEKRLDAPVAELEAEAGRCEAAIQEIGPVNPAAVEEYRRAADRYDFMLSQSEDLEKAAASLRQIIADIDRTMAEKFEEGFAAINAHFSDIFVRLFGGGSAVLELSEADSVLESGVEIFVQPPGKRRQNLALLSGGERALTVISILFSFLAYRPAPFCVIDEIDSALDESNVRRFSEFLSEYSKHSQFIVVTHRKGTMEAADILHGVTMEDSGVSRLVSVKFQEEGQQVEEGRMMRGTN